MTEYYLVWTIPTNCTMHNVFGYIFIIVYFCSIFSAVHDTVRTDLHLTSIYSTDKLSLFAHFQVSSSCEFTPCFWTLFADRDLIYSCQVCDETWNTYEACLWKDC